MSIKKQKVMVAMSGGVDSSVSAALLLREGYDCAGVYMITCDAGAQGSEKARRVAEKEGIEFFVLDMRKSFDVVFEYLISEYERGRTPNPCVFCNRHIKFGRLFQFAREKGADLLATGHYARLVRRGDGVGLYAAEHAKDQSYVLAMIEAAMLGNLILPLGDMTKERARGLADEFGLDVGAEGESQDICFIPDNDYAGEIERRCPGLVRRGAIVDSEGKRLAEHDGIHRYTIGQRRGLRVAMGEPWYVTGLDAETNTVTLGPREELMHCELEVEGINWFVSADRIFDALVKIRYNSEPRRASVRACGGRAVVRFEEPQAAITPGQACVFYVRDEAGLRLVGGGWIDRVGE